MVMGIQIPTSTAMANTSNTNMLIWELEISHAAEQPLMKRKEKLKNCKKEKLHFADVNPRQ